MDKTKFKDLFNPLLVFFIAITIRGLYLIEFYKNPFFDYIPEAFDQYWFIKGAEQVASGKIFGPLIGAEKFSVVYTYFLGIIFYIFGKNYLIAYSIQFVIGAVSCVIIYLITKRLFSENTALIASIYYSSYGPIIFHEGKFLRESLFIFFLIVSFYFLVLFSEKNSYAIALPAALFSSLFMQTRPNSVLLIPLILYYLYSLYFSSSNQRRKGPLVVFCISFFLVSLPLLIRGYIISNRLIFYDDSAFITLALGNSLDYPGFGWGHTDIYRKFLSSGEVNLKNTLLHISSNFLYSPINFIYLYLKKLFYLFNNWEIASNVSYYIYEKFSLILRLPTSNFSIPFSLGIAGMLLEIKNLKKTKLLYLYLAGLFFSIVFIWINARFRLPLVPFLIIFSASTITRLAENIKFNKSRVLVYLIIIIALMIFSNSPIGRDEIRPNDYGNTGFAYMENTRLRNLSLAEKYFEKASSEDSITYGFGTGYYIRTNIFLANFYQKQGRFDEAYRKYLKVKKVMPFDPYLESKIGDLFLIKKDYPQAIEHLKKAIELNPENPIFYNNLGMAYGYCRDYKKAILEFKKFINLNPYEPIVYYNLSKAYSLIGLKREAEDAFGKGKALEELKKIKK